ncbi:MAG: cupin [Chloroflexi bacterium]|nr:MAG: cupin [Chloroflexota bacterium]
MFDNYKFIENLPAELPEIPPDSIVSRQILRTNEMTVTLFGFASGQELSEHTAAFPAVLHFLAGEATVTLGSERFTATADSWIYMPAKLPHSIVAHKKVAMLLILLRG